MYDREIKQRLSESRAKRVWTMPSWSCFDRRSNIVNPTQKEAQTFGYTKDLITLSLSLRYSPTITYTLLRLAGTRVNIRLSMQSCKGGRIVFYPYQNDFINIEEYED